MYLAIDPGHTTGWALFDSAGQIVSMGMVKNPDDFFNWLDALESPVEVVVLEEYKLFQRKAIQQSGSDMVASRVIGGVEYWAGRKGIKVIRQPASIKKIAEMWTGKKPPSNHDLSHEIDAYNHGMYYLIKNKIRMP